jgi:hypothetical protein
MQNRSTTSRVGIALLAGGTAATVTYFSTQKIVEAVMGQDSSQTHSEGPIDWIKNNIAIVAAGSVGLTTTICSLFAMRNRVPRAPVAHADVELNPLYRPL